MANHNPTNFRTMYFSKAELQKALDALPDATTIVLGVEDGDMGASDIKIVWANNCRFGDSRQVVFINPVKEGE